MVLFMDAVQALKSSVDNGTYVGTYVSLHHGIEAGIFIYALIGVMTAAGLGILDREMSKIV